MQQEFLPVASDVGAQHRGEDGVWEGFLTHGVGQSGVVGVDDGRGQMLESAQVLADIIRDELSEEEGEGNGAHDGVDVHVELGQQRSRHLSEEEREEEAKSTGHSEDRDGDELDDIAGILRLQVLNDGEGEEEGDGLLDVAVVVLQAQDLGEREEVESSWHLVGFCFF